MEQINYVAETLSI